jgi:hypothetical protein
MSPRTSVLWAVIALATGCAAREPATEYVAPTPPAAGSAAHGVWRLGPRDSAAASTVACRVLQKLADTEAACALVGYRETTVAYVFRFREPDWTGAVAARGARLEVWLAKDGGPSRVELVVP